MVGEAIAELLDNAYAAGALHDQTATEIAVRADVRSMTLAALYRMVDVSQ
jgi:hypothetical protein